MYISVVYALIFSVEIQVFNYQIKLSYLCIYTKFIGSS